MIGMTDEFDFGFHEEEYVSHKKKLLVLVIYDIIDNRKRTKFAKHMEGYGNRVQKSAFEARLTQKKYKKLLNEIPKFCGNDDSIRVYRIVGESHITAWGLDEIPIDSEDIVVI